MNPVRGWPMQVLAACLCLPAPAALAHGFAGSGMLHPLTGWDHVLAMLAVGAWSAQIGGTALFLVPAAFVLAMAAGGAVAMLVAPLPGTEALIAASVFGLGLAIAIDRRLAWPVATATTMLFGLAHGSAHGAEIPAVAEPAGYVIGFLFTTAGLHVTGAVAGLLALEGRGGRAGLRSAGWLTAASGVALVLTA